MRRYNKHSEESFLDQEYSEENEEYNTNEDDVCQTDNYPKQSFDDNEEVKGIISASDLDPERLLYDIRKSLLGYDKRGDVWVRVSEPLARTEFITLYINSLRSLVTFHHLFSISTSEESAFNMLESLNEIVYAAVDYGIKEEHIETLINMYDTIKSTFYGIIINGRGTENIKQVVTSKYQNLSTNDNENKSILNWEELKNTLRK